MEEGKEARRSSVNCFPNGDCFCSLCSSQTLRCIADENNCVDSATPVGACNLVQRYKHVEGCLHPSSQGTGMLKVVFHHAEQSMFSLMNMVLSAKRQEQDAIAPLRMSCGVNGVDRAAGETISKSAGRHRGIEDGLSHSLRCDRVAVLQWLQAMYGTVQNSLVSILIPLGSTHV